MFRITALLGNILPPLCTSFQTVSELSVNFLCNNRSWLVRDLTDEHDYRLITVCSALVVTVGKR